MNADEVSFVLRALGSRQLKRGHRYVNGTCPLARWRHKGGHDLNPSFGISIDPDRESRFRCFGCGIGGSLFELLWAVEGHSNTRHPEVQRFIQAHNRETLAALQARLDRLSKEPEVVYQELRAQRLGLKAEPGPYGPVATDPQVQPPPLPESELWHFRFLPEDVMEWHQFKKRYITRETLDRFGVLWHPRAQRLAVPVRNEHGGLLAITGRRANDFLCPRCNVTYLTVHLGGKDRKRCPRCERGQPPKYLHSTGFRRDFALFGEDHAAGASGEGVLVEGHFDAMAVAQAGYPCVAAMGSWLSWWQLRQLRRLFSAITIFPDGDHAGRVIAHNFYKTLRPVMPVRIAQTPEGKDPDELPDEERARLLREAPEGEVFLRDFLARQPVANQRELAIL